MILPRCPFTPLPSPPETSAPSSQISRLDYLEPNFWGGRGGRSKWNESRGKFPPSRVTTESFLMNDFHLEVKGLGRTIPGGFFTIYHHANLFYNFVHLFYKSRCSDPVRYFSAFLDKLHIRIKFWAPQSNAFTSA